jgi:uncharacterized protein (TIGR02145 family)
MKRSLSLLFLTCLLFSSAAIAANKVVVIPLGRALGGTQIVEVTSATGQVWMDRNLGALRVATKKTDSDAYGSLYQWGRPADGHEYRTSPLTTTRSNNPGHGSFITVNASPYDWRITQDDTLWASESSPNNPCPAGFRLPTAAEWEIEINSWNGGHSGGAFTSPLKLVVAGSRSTYNGTIGNAGIFGFYRSSTVSLIHAIKFRPPDLREFATTPDRKSGAIPCREISPLPH